MSAWTPETDVRAGRRTRPFYSGKRLVHGSNRNIIQVPPRQKGTQMALSDLAIVLATRDDVPGILDLQERNLLENGEQLSVRWPAEWFEHAITDIADHCGTERHAPGGIPRF